MITVTSLTLERNDGQQQLALQLRRALTEPSVKTSYSKAIL